MAIQGDLAQILSGIPIKIDSCNIAITQPSIKDICVLGENFFLEMLQVFINMDKLVVPIKEGNSQLAMLSDFQVFIVALEEDKSMISDINKFFELILPNYKWNLTPGSISFSLKESDDNIPIGQLNPFNIEDFQTTLKTLFLPSNKKDGEEREFNPANDAAAEIAKKLQKGREERAKIKNKDQEENESLFGNYLSLLSVGLPMDINVLYSYTPFQLFDLLFRFMAKNAYDLYLQISMVPFADTSSVKEPTNWMDSLY